MTATDLATFVVDLDDPASQDPSAAGGKAAALARVRRADMATMPGAVITTAYSELVDAGGDHVDAVTDAVVAQVTALVAPDGAPLVVRSSSVVEDSRASSHAGQFESVLDVRGPDQLRAAIATVLDSRRRAGAADAPIAVLVQPMLQPEVAGVAFGIDPVSGRSDRRVVTAVRGTPDGLVGGAVDGSRWELDRSGHICDADPRDGVQLSRSRLRAVADLGDQLGREFGCPQDVEWAIVDGRLLVLQSRPVTTEVRGEPRGPIFGPGPVAETFPEPLSTLEIDLWVPPLREGLRAALELVGAAGRRAIEASDLVVTIDGRVAIDLEVTGELHQPGSIGHRLAARGRRLRGAWRVGRLRVALPRLAADLSARADRDLEAVPPLEQLSTRQLVALIGRGRTALRSLHAHEILLGLVADPGSSRFTGASVALQCWWRPAPTASTTTRSSGGRRWCWPWCHLVWGRAWTCRWPPRPPTSPTNRPRPRPPRWHGSRCGCGSAGCRRWWAKRRARWAIDWCAGASSPTRRSSATSPWTT